MNALKCRLSRDHSWYLGQSRVVTYHTHSHTDWHAFPHTDLMVGTHVPVFYHRVLKPADSCAAAAALSHSRTVTWTTDKEVNTKHEADINYRWQLWFIPLWNHFQNCVQGEKKSISLFWVWATTANHCTPQSCAPEPITAQLTSTTYLKKQADLYLQRRKLDQDFAGGSVPFCASKLTVLD